LTENVKVLEAARKDGIDDPEDLSKKMRGAGRKHQRDQGKQEEGI